MSRSWALSAVLLIALISSSAFSQSHELQLGEDFTPRANGSSGGVLARDFYSAQVWPKQGPWFEGWYARITDHREQRSVAFILTSFRRGTEIAGYESLILHDPKIGKPMVWERFPDRTHIGPFYQNPESGNELRKESVRLQYSAEGSNGSRLLPVEMIAAWGNPKPWSRELSSWGPAGWVTFLRWFPLQWFVYSLGSEVRYKITLEQADGTPLVLAGSGSLHMEKNWGRNFPKAYMWLQATSADHSSHLAIAGGKMEFGPLFLETYLVGYRSPRYQVDFRLGQALNTEFASRRSPCEGKYELMAQNNLYHLRVDSHAEPSSFFGLSTPDKNSYVPNHAMQSFASRTRARLFQRGRLLETLYFENSALEFGGEFRRDASGALCAPRFHGE